MNYYTQITAEDTIPNVSVKDYKELTEKLEGTGLSAELWNRKGSNKNEKGDLYIYGEDYFFIENGAVECIGHILKKSKKEYIEMGLAFYADKARPSSCGGTALRITSDGDLVWSERVWPTKESKKQKVWVIQVHCRDGADDFVTVDGAFSTVVKAKARMKQYSNCKRSEETGEAYYSPDEMKLVCLEVE